MKEPAEKREILFTRRSAMKTRVVHALAAGLLLLAGCGKSNTNSMQNATPQQAPAPNAQNSNQTATPQQAAAPTPSTSPSTAPEAAPGPAPVQIPTQEQAQAANPTNAQTPAPPPEPPKPFLVPAGTSLPVILATSISSYKNQAGENFSGNLAAPIMVDGEEAVPKGAKVTGTIVDAKKQGKFKGEALLTIRVASITVRGKEYPIATHTWSNTEKGKGKRTAVITGGGAAVGALIGGLAGGGKGAGIGAAVGGGGGLAASGGTGGANVNLPAESKITFKLSKSVTIDR
jgi:hypothetical protein